MNPPNRNLDQISTHWHSVNDPLQFVMRYAPAIQSYLLALLKNAHDAEEVAQDFLLRMQQHGFAGVKAERGRFRDYLKRAVRNAALNYLQRSKSRRQVDISLLQLGTPATAASADEQEWLQEWRKVLLDRAWRTLERRQGRTPDNPFFTALRLTVAHPQEDSVALAARLSAAVGRTVRPETFRKQLSRARLYFAQFLVEEVAQTLEEPTSGQLAEELTELGLMTYVRPYLEKMRAEG